MGKVQENLEELQLIEMYQLMVLIYWVKYKYHEEKHKSSLRW